MAINLNGNAESTFLSDVDIGGKVHARYNSNHPDEASLNISGANNTKFIQFYDRVNTTNNSFIYDNGFLTYDGSATFNGELKVSTSSTGSTYINSGGDGTALIYFQTNAPAELGKIRINGAGVAYDTTSDYRLKENVVPIAGAAQRIKSLKPCRFNFISHPDKTVDGFLAHEAQEVVPEAVSGIKDEVDEEGNPIIQGIDQSKLVPLLTAALQEALAKIETLETRLTALEGGTN